MIFIEIFAGVGLTLFGVRFLRKGLDRLFGGKLYPWLTAMAGNRCRGFLGGIVAGAVAPSSTAMALMAVQMRQVGELRTDRVLAMLLGANVGITIMVQFLAFRITDYTGWFIGIGVVMFQFLNRPIFRGIGQSLLSLGFIFLAMRLISTAAGSISQTSDMLEFFSLLERWPLVVILATMILAVSVQSSTAAIAVGLALAAAGIVSPGLLVPWVIGTNLGLSVTALIAGWRDFEGRRLVTANFLLKLLVALPLIFIPSLGIAIFEWMPGNFSRETAMFHTFFNLLVGLLALPFLTQISKVVAWMILDERQSNESSYAPGTYLDSAALNTPSLAIAHATRETLRMADDVKWMLVTFWRAFEFGDSNKAIEIRQRDHMVDSINTSLTDYLGSLNEGMSEEDARWQFALLSFSNELESVGDIVDKQFSDLLLNRQDQHEVLPMEDLARIRELYERIVLRFDQAIALLTTRNDSDVEDFLRGKESLNNWCREIQHEHYMRLTRSHAAVMGTSTLFLELLNGFRRINSHITTIGYTFQNRSQRNRKET